MSRTDQKLSPPVRTGRRISNTQLSLIIVGAFIVVVAVLIGIAQSGDGSSGSDNSGGPGDGGPTAQSLAVRPDSNRLSTAPGSTVNFVEFLDFECEACGAAYPAVEELRQQYGNRVNFVIRYFPIQSHFNAERAARTVEAAAQQGRLEPMYKMMYDTQKEWSEQQVPMDDRFRGYAQQLGLDMARFDQVYNDPATLERIRADREDGLKLGVTGTPSFYVNGKKLEPKSVDDLTGALDDALAQR